MQPANFALLVVRQGDAGLAGHLQALLYLGHVEQVLVEDLAETSDCLVVFQGAENYVTPSWYPSKKETGKVVPTWNYETVQVRGVPKVIHDAEWLKNLVTTLTAEMEAPRQKPWQVSDAPHDFIDAQLKAIVGLEIEITSVEGKWKMSQNRTAQDAKGVALGLADPGDPHHNPEVAAIVASRNQS